jgi:hypothetical protein
MVQRCSPGVDMDAVGGALSARLQHMRVVIIQVLVNHPGTRAEEELPQRWTTRKCMLLGLTLAVDNPHHEDPAG